MDHLLHKIYTHNHSDRYLAGGSKDNGIQQLDICALISYQDESLRQYHEELTTMQKKGWCTIDNNGKIELTDEGMKQIPSKGLHQKAPLDVKCRDCEGRGYSIRSTDPSNPSAGPIPTAVCSPLLETFDRLVKERPRVKEEYDQWPMDGEHAFYRVSFFHSRGDLLDKELIFIGDDDLLSIAASLTRLPKRVVMLEVDEQLVDFVNKVAIENDLPLKAYKYDVRFPLSKEFLGKFDVFTCDPVETIGGIKLFLSRGIQALRGVRSSCYFGLTSLEASKRKWFEIQKMIHQMNFALTDIRRNFTAYPDPGWEDQLPIWANFSLKPTCLWYKSAFYRLEAVDTPNPIVTQEYSTLDPDIYVDDEAWATTTHKSEPEQPEV